MRSLALVLSFISLFFIKFARSQSKELLIQGQTGKLYLEHTVVAGENWYSVGRLYNASPKEMAPFNKLAMTQPLKIGEHLLIPLTAANFSQNGVKSAAETLVPLYHIIQEKEWMYRISVNHNKVPISSLEKWNNINKDQARAGMHLIVGFLKVKTAQSALAKNGTAPAIAADQGEAPAAGSKAPASKATVPAASSKAATVTTATGAPSDGSKASTPAAGSKTTTPPVSKPPVITATVATTPVTVKDSGDKQTATKTKEAAIAKETHAPASPAGDPAIHFNGGYFKADFTDGGKLTSGPAGIFKSTSGWQDGKYYALMNNTPVGTIIKITVLSTGKSVYAKILGQLPDMKESAGMTVRISNAAASELGEGDGRFNVQVRY